MRNRWLAFALLIAMGALLMGAAACKSSSSSTKKTSTPVKTAAATMAVETPMTSQTMPMATANKTPMGTPTVVSATLTEFKITLGMKSAPAGTVMFDVKNIGGTAHEFHVVKTDLAPAALPTKADGSFDDSAPGTTMVDHITGIAKGQEKTLTVNLKPGHYVILCNVVQTTANGTPTSHFMQGMHTEFTVTQ